MVAERKRTSPAVASAPGAVAVGGGQPGDGSSASVAESELKKVKTKPLRSEFFSGMEVTFCFGILPRAVALPHAAVMAETWRYRGQEIGGEQLAFLREFIAAHPTSSRWKLCFTRPGKERRGGICS